MEHRIEKIGDATLYLGDCREILPGLKGIDHVIMDPPYSARTHAGHDAAAKGGRSAGKDAAERVGLGYAALSAEDARELAADLSKVCDGWIVWMTDHVLAPVISNGLADGGRYVFAPLPFYAPGRSVRITGDGPCSWTDWIVVGRTSRLSKWGTLPGGYSTGSGSGWNDKARMGGKPSALMTAIVRDYSRQSETVLDPFMGAGTTGVACVQMGRRFVGCEIDPLAFEVARQRIEDAYKQPRLFSEPAPKAAQPSMFDGEVA